MRMTSGRLIALRLYSITLGRLPIFSRLLRRVLVALLITSKRDRYMASSRFFSMDELD